MDVVLLFYAIFYATTDRYFFYTYDWDKRMVCLQKTYYVCEKCITFVTNSIMFSTNVLHLQVTY